MAPSFSQVVLMIKVNNGEVLHIWYKGAKESYTYETVREYSISHTMLFIRFKMRKVNDSFIALSAKIPMNEISRVEIKRKQQFSHRNIVPLKSRSYGSQV